jgi:hypothetical protein
MEPSEEDMLKARRVQRLLYLAMAIMILAPLIVFFLRG